MRSRLAPVAGLALLVTVSTGSLAYAAPIEHEGLIFSDEEGGFRLLSVSGRGSPEDPIVVTEEVTEDRDVVLIIRNFSRAFGNRAGTQHVASFAVRKVVINRTSRVWPNYQMELRESPSRHSPYEDGLSFGQNSRLGESYVASSFPQVQRFDEPEDTLGFGGALVAPGESAVFSFIVSDMSPSWTVYLFQEPLQPLSERTPSLAPAAKSHGEARIGRLSWPRWRRPAVE
jgi:hypothetical protein